MAEKLAFIIPCLNEEKNIGHALESIKNAMDVVDYEIIVCDNGSIDSTRSIASRAGATVLIDFDATISKLRNIGAAATDAGILVFIDADVTIDKSWYLALLNSMKNWPHSKLLISGSRCLAPAEPSLINEHWFSLLNDSESKYINSGHMLVTRTTFNLIFGFNENLETSEDYDFCERAKKAGVQILPDQKLISYHHGYPKNLTDFIIRESWHGKEDASSLEKLTKSKTALVAFGLSTARIAGISIIATTKFTFIGILILAISLFASMAIVKIKFKNKNIDSFFVTHIIFELYLFGRTLALIRTRKRPKARC